MLSFKQYPRNWRKVSAVIKRIAGYCCEECGKPVHSVHHKGAAWATGDGWRPGRRGDKHDLRRENLVALCFSCHDSADNGALSFYAALRARGQGKRARHRALCIGTGLVPVQPVRVSSFHFYVFARLHYALLRWSKRAGRTQYQLIGQPTHIIDSYLIRDEVSYEAARC
jgi:hypothetical protein